MNNKNNLCVLSHIIMNIINIFFQLRTWLFKIVGMKDPKEDAVVARREYNLESEILAWRIKLRRERYMYTCTYIIE